ncbi:EamA family transporter [Sphingobacterium haloxyli]|uniref:EamA family transporter n=1 Tax=Sphingobacterium haloxyli TaxID=2100533 RepID=A0A2S9J586_9SPHI|nr:DMT family transporter [Sphingobacterium haloxyli]PRD47899.1 EamA family transporter [Sphingobacterium haloxyli]
MDREQVKGIIAVVLGAASFGILSTFVKKAYAQGFTLGEVTGIQALFGMSLLWGLIGVMFIAKIGYFSRFPAGSPKWHIIVSGLSTGAVSILYYKSVQLVPASLAIILLMQYIWIGQLIEFIFFKTRLTRRQAIGIAAILGSTVLATGLLEHDFKSISVVGIGYGLLAATAYALFIIVSGRVGNDHPPLHKSAYMIIGAFLLVFIVLQPFSLFTVSVFSSLWRYGLLLSVFGTVLPPLLFSYGIPKTGVSLGNILSYIELPVAVCMSYIVLKEHVSIWQFIGVAGILVVVILLNVRRR